MRRATDQALKNTGAAKCKSTFLITPVLSRFYLKEVIRKVTIGVDFSIWGYAFFLSFFFFIFFLSSIVNSSILFSLLYNFIIFYFISFH